MEKYSVIYFAGGCFWGTQHFFQLVNGVVKTEVGYANGSTQHPKYEELSQTGHAETVRVVYDPQIVELSLLLQLFFRTIDPTSLNRQGADEGTQYRTGIYFVDPNHLPEIQAEMDKLAKKYRAPIVVEVAPLQNFSPAEAYHQDYLNKNAGGYCHIAPSLFALAKTANQK